MVGVLSKLLKPDSHSLPKIYDGEQPTEWIGVMEPEMYHGDKTRINSSAIRKILRTPRHFLSWWLGLDKDENAEEPDYFRMGRAAHMMLLEPDKFKAAYVIQPDFGDMRSSKNRDARDKWRLDQPVGAVVLSEEEMGRMVGMAESVLEHKVAANLLSNGRPEMTVLWTDPETKVGCRGRPDYLVEDKEGGLHIVDFKTTRDVRQGIFAHEIRRHQYFVQLAFYHDGVMQVLKKQPASLTIVAVEKEPPFECAVHILDDKWFEKGQEAYRHALKIYRKCLTENYWPAYQQGAGMLSAPNAIDYDSLPEFDWNK